MRRLAVLCCCLAALGGCVTLRHAPAGAPPPTGAPAPWGERLAQLEHAVSWRLDGRAAAALGQQGWQASLDWQQDGASSEVHLAGPLGMGAADIKVTPQGLSLNGAPPSGAVAAQLESKLGFELPLDTLRFWLLGIPDPALPFEITRNPQDRALKLSQAGWTVDYDAYMPSNGDVLPKRLVLSRADARVRIVVDRWQGTP